MKTIWLLAFCALAASAYALEESERENGENGWYIPKEDGTFEWVDMDEAEEWLDRQEAMEDRALITTTPVKFYLYTSSNPSKGTKITTTAKSISGSNFNAAHPTRIVIHGWTQSYTSSMNKEIRAAWLSHGDYNVIIVDWARARSVDYASSVVAVPTVGKKVAALVNYLKSDHGLDLNNLYVIGHSLGAHVAGYTGKNTDGQVHTIIGLDPALPLFNYNKPNKRLSSTDAYYVESIQTNGGTLGFLKPIGKGAFYPNGGKTQPGCTLDVTGACSHGRSVTYYAEAVSQDNFGTMKCSNYEDAVAKECGSTYSSVRMGADTNAYMVEGDFYVPVNSKAPYGNIN
ncbi:phospholipase A1 VesT1.02-like [Drosophila sulfurigaster albostrigata]|uniref:phospholipase A1 VesT1.02-like n=1 Tax=Drosophila sulfurigaster albostrigata TaxID=89887 RepID=UPI002D218964|nr:phospholipase A1 VesT1.02-like [Drosophila sulfurigaster albostrigata]